MITGDHLDTAVAIGKQLGIITDASQAITGAQLDELSDEELNDKSNEYSVYARVQPEHKVRIVNAWQSQGQGRFHDRRRRKRCPQHQAAPISASAWALPVRM